MSIPALDSSNSHTLCRVTFTVFFLPVPNLCLASLIAALAVHDDAFEPRIDSVQTLLQRPNLEVDYVPLKWKQEVLNKPILPLDYRTYRDLWRRACLVAGFREDPHLYTLRVGCGMDLDGKSGLLVNWSG